ncbi:MAG: hypothetical protein K2Y71_02815 [Xanthobacteraceae bacterium]|nr:hypothetical protein [Xanthobacteraceae bacterium]
MPKHSRAAAAVIVVVPTSMGVAEYFHDAKPATTTVQVVRLATDPRCLIEINAVAVVD